MNTFAADPNWINCVRFIPIVGVDKQIFMKYSPPKKKKAISIVTQIAK